MREIEGIEKIVEKLKPHWQQIDTHFNEENARFKRLLAREHDTLGRVLKCHLIVEHYVNRFLEAHYGIEDIEGVRLSFFQKAQLLPNERTAAAFVKPGILKLNAIRNRFGHELDTGIEPHDLGAIHKALLIARPNAEFQSPIEAVEAFTTVACTFLIVAPPDLQEVFADAFSEVRVNVR